MKPFVVTAGKLASRGSVRTAYSAGLPTTPLGLLQTAATGPMVSPRMKRMPLRDGDVSRKLAG